MDSSEKHHPRFGVIWFGAATGTTYPPKCYRSTPRSAGSIETSQRMSTQTRMNRRLAGYRALVCVEGTDASRASSEGPALTAPPTPDTRDEHQTLSVWWKEETFIDDQAGPMQMNTQRNKCNKTGSDNIERDLSVASCLGTRSGCM